MVHPLLAASEFRGYALTALNATFEELCRELKLKPHRRDRLTDMIAETVLQCVRDGKTDQAHMLACARQVLEIDLRGGDGAHPHSDP